MSRHFLSKSARNTSAWKGIASMELPRCRHVAAIPLRRANSDADSLVGLSGRGGPTRNRNSEGRPRRRGLRRIAGMNGYEVAGNVWLRPEEKARPNLLQAWGHRIAPACEQFRPSAQRR